MPDRNLLTLALAGALVAILPATSGRAADKPKGFTLSSPAYRNGGAMPKKFAGVNPQNKGCDGEGISAPLRWSNAPEAAKSFVLVLFDPAGRAPLGVLHMAAYDIPASTKGLKEGELSKPAGGFKFGKNIAGQEAYLGPCPPLGQQAHPYTYVLLATDIAPGTLQAGLNQEDLAKALQGHVLDSTSLVGRYRPLK